MRQIACISLCTMLLSSLPAKAQAIANGDMSDGYILASGDTIVAGWSEKACESNVCMSYDDETFLSAPASMHLVSSASHGGTVWTQNLMGLSGLDGQVVTLRGWARTDGMGPGAVLKIALVPSCGGGGYKQLEYIQVLKEMTNRDWSSFSSHAAPQRP